MSPPEPRHTLLVELGSFVAGTAVASLAAIPLCLVLASLADGLGEVLVPAWVFLAVSGAVLALAFAVNRSWPGPTGRALALGFVVASSVVGAGVARATHVVFADGWAALLAAPLPSAPTIPLDAVIRIGLLVAFAAGGAALRWVAWEHLGGRPEHVALDAVLSGIALIAVFPLGVLLIEGMIVAAVRRAILARLEPRVGLDRPRPLE